MTSFGSHVQRFWRELRRRGVVRVGGVYIVASLALISAAELILPALLLPDWTYRLVVILALLGLPLVLVLAWAFDLTADGVRRATPAEADSGSPDPSRATPVPSSRAFNRIAVTGAILVLALAGGAFLVLGGGEEPATEPGTIAVLPFTVRGGEDVQVLAEGMVELLGTKLDGAGAVRTTDTRAVLQVAKGLEPGGADGVARRLGAEYYVTGSALELGGALQLHAGIYATDRPDSCLATAAVEGPVEGFLELVDDLAADLLTTGALAPPGRMPRIAALTTRSLPALKAFLRGERAIRAARYEDAIPLFQRAVETDSTFALAHYRLAVAAWWAERGAVRRTATASALRHADRLTERDRAMVEAFAAARSGGHAEAERRYRALVASYPDDVEAWYELAEVIFHRGYLLGYSPIDSWEPFERALELDPGHGSSLFHLSNLAAAVGDTTLLDSLTRRFRQGRGQLEQPGIEGQWAFAAGDSLARGRTLEAMTGGEADLAAVFFAMLGTYDPATIRRIGDAALAGAAPEVRLLMAGRVASELLRFGLRDEALGTLERAEAASPAPDPGYRVYMATLPFLRTPRPELERIREQLTAWDPGPPITEPTPWRPNRPHALFQPQLRTYLLALAENRLGRRDTALRLADELESMDGLPEVRTLAADLARHVRGRVDLDLGRPDIALAAIEPASFWETLTWDERVSPILAHFGSVFLRAEALQELGRYREAIRWYRAATVGAPWRAYSYYRMGQAHEALQEPAEAAQAYAIFVHLWAEADPELQPMVEHARSRLAHLTGEGSGIE